MERTALIVITDILIIKMVHLIKSLPWAFLLLFISCERNKSIVVRYPNGAPKYIWNFEQDTLNGLKTGYWENGRTAYVLSFSNGQKNGNFTYYYDNGAISSTGTYYNDRLRGYYKKYFPSDSGKIKTECYIIQVKQKEYFFYTRTYSIEGGVLSENRFLDIGIVDQVKEKTLGFKYVDKQVFDSTKLIIGGFNSDFDVIGNPDTFKILNDIAVVPLNSTYVEDGFIRGEFVGYHNVVKGDTVHLRIWTNYFEVKQQDLTEIKLPAM